MGKILGRKQFVSGFSILHWGAMIQNHLFGHHIFSLLTIYRRSYCVREEIRGAGIQRSLSVETNTGFPERGGDSYFLHFCNLICLSFCLL